MSAGVSSGGNSQDVELNLASIIDCFTVLIAFMLASASFLSIGILDAGVAAAGTTSAGGEPPAVNITIELTKEQAFQFKVSGKASFSRTIPAKGRDYDYEALAAQLAQAKTQWPSVTA